MKRGVLPLGPFILYESSIECAETLSSRGIRKVKLSRAGYPAQAEAYGTLGGFGVDPVGGLIIIKDSFEINRTVSRRSPHAASSEATITGFFTSTWKGT